MVFLRNHEMTTIQGTRDKRLIRLLSAAAQYYCGRLLSKRMIYNIHIDVVLRKDIEHLGYCEISGYNKSGKPRYFTIELDKSLNTKTLLMTLAHECVHLKQYVMGEMNENLNVWRGKYINSDNVPYWDHPWEVEAYGRERGLFVRFAEAHELSDTICSQALP